MNAENSDCFLGRNVLAHTYKPEKIRQKLRSKITLSTYTEFQNLSFKTN